MGVLVGVIIDEAKREEQYFFHLLFFLLFLPLSTPHLLPPLSHNTDEDKGVGDRGWIFGAERRTDGANFCPYKFIYFRVRKICQNENQIEIHPPPLSLSLSLSLSVVLSL